MEIGKVIITKDGIYLQLDIPFHNEEITSELEKANEIIANAIYKAFELADK